MAIHKSKRNSATNLFAVGFRRFMSSKLAVVLVCVTIALAVFFAVLAMPPRYTVINEISEYGNYSGTSASRFTDQYISSFFPEEIQPCFSNITYSYKAENTDTYGFEAYLEFTIEDESQFNEYIAEITRDREWQDFAFDTDFRECNIENVFDLNTDHTDDPTSVFYRQILYSKVRKILFSPETHTVIYVAIGVYDGGGIGTNYLNTFFERFQIDPVEYAKAATSGYGIDPFGV